MADDFHNFPPPIDVTAVHAGSRFHVSASASPPLGKPTKTKPRRLVVQDLLGPAFNHYRCAQDVLDLKRLQAFLLTFGAATPVVDLVDALEALQRRSWIDPVEPAPSTGEAEVPEAGTCAEAPRPACVRAPLRKRNPTLPGRHR